MNIDKVLERIGKDCKSLKREIYNPDVWSMEEMLHLVTEIGKTIIPSFTIDRSNKFVYENLIYWVMGDSRMKAYGFNGSTVKGDVKKGIYLGGPVGTGKTTATEILSKLVYALGIKIKIGDDTPISLKWKSCRTDYIVSQFIRNGEVDDIKREPVICFQDLGTEPLEALYMGNRTNVMKQIIEYRGDHRETLTLFTSNLNINDPALVTMYGERAVSRLNSMCNLLVLGGKDRRR